MPALLVPYWTGYLGHLFRRAYGSFAELPQRLRRSQSACALSTSPDCFKTILNAHNGSFFCV